MKTEDLKRIIVDNINLLKDVYAIEINKNHVYLFEGMDDIVKVKNSSYGNKKSIHFYDLKYFDKIYHIFVNEELNEKDIKFVHPTNHHNNKTITVDIVDNFKVQNSGIYELINEKDVNERYVILISGVEPFLKKEIIWDKNKNIIINNDKLRGKNFIWIMR